MKLVLFIFTAVLFSSATATAFWGNDAGNGGYTVRCGNRVEVLDYHEIRTKFVPGTFTLDLPGQDEWSRVANVLLRLIRLDSARASRYAKELDRFKQLAHFVPRVSLPSTLDLGRPFIESGCHAEQAAIQFKDPFPGQSPYMVSATIYAELSDEQKAGLILHEIIYREALQLGATDSMGARYFNAVISSREINFMSSAEYAKRVAAAGLIDPNLPNGPVWITDPANLRDGKAGRPYVADLTGFAQSPKGVPLSYRILSGPKWLGLVDNELKGTPAAADVGTNVWEVEASDGAATATAKLRMQVLPSSPGPLWLRAVNKLWTMQPNGPTEINLPGFVQTHVGKMTFQVNGAPAWLKLNPTTGLMTGTPSLSDTGAFAFEAIATDDTGSSSARFELSVASANDLAVRAGQVLTLNINSPQYLGAVGTENATFLVHSLAPSFLTLTPNGVLTLRPTQADIGTYAVDIEVRDAGGGGLLVPFRIIVQREPHPPVWRQTTFRFSLVKQNAPFLADLSQYAYDPDGGPITFSLLWGDHHWLSVAPDGTLTGTPGKNDLGDSTFLLQTTNVYGEASEATVYIEVVR